MLFYLQYKLKKVVFRNKPTKFVQAFFGVISDFRNSDLLIKFTFTVMVNSNITTEATEDLRSLLYYRFPTIKELFIVIFGSSLTFLTITIQHLFM